MIDYTGYKEEEEKTMDIFPLIIMNCIGNARFLCLFDHIK